MVEVFLHSEELPDCQKIHSIVRVNNYELFLFLAVIAITTPHLCLLSELL